jgi:hypothetical protein
MYYQSLAGALAPQKQADGSFEHLNLVTEIPHRLVPFVHLVCQCIC